MGVSRTSGLCALLAAACLADQGCGEIGETLGVGGHVRLEDGTAVEGVQVLLTWPQYPSGAKTVATDAEGGYEWEWYATGLAGPPLDRVVVTPEDPGYVFEPSCYDLELGGDRWDLDFTALPIAEGQEAVGLVLRVLVIPTDSEAGLEVHGPWVLRGGAERRRGRAEPTQSPPAK